MSFSELLKEEVVEEEDEDKKEESKVEESSKEEKAKETVSENEPAQVNSFEEKDALQKNESSISQNDVT